MFAVFKLFKKMHRLFSFALRRMKRRPIMVDSGEDPMTV